jgi:hypothetical protein
VNRPAAAALAAILTVGAAAARAADAPEARVAGTVLMAQVSSDPGAGSLVILDKAGRSTKYSVRDTTHLTRDGKDIKFDTTLIGDLVVRAKFDPKTKTLTLLDLKSFGSVKPSKNAAAPATFSGEVAFADAVKGELSVRKGKGATREFAVVETTKVLRETADKPAREAGFETVTVGELVEVRTRDGKTADEIRVRPAAR